MELQNLHESYKDKGLVVLGVNCADDRKIALELLEKDSVTFPNSIDSSEATQKVFYRDYRASGVPLNYIIDREGRVAAAWYGYSRKDRRAADVLERLGVRRVVRPDRVEDRRRARDRFGAEVANHDREAVPRDRPRRERALDRAQVLEREGVECQVAAGPPGDRQVLDRAGVAVLEAAVRDPALPDVPRARDALDGLHGAEARLRQAVEREGAIAAGHDAGQLLDEEVIGGALDLDRGPGPRHRSDRPRAAVRLTSRRP